MIDRARVLVVAAPDAQIRVLEERLQDPDLLIVPCPTAKAALDQLALGMPDVVVVDASVPGAQVFRVYNRLRGSAAGLGVPLIFTNHTGAELGSQTATVPDYYLGPDVDLGDVEQLLFTFLPESLVEIEEPEPLPEPLPVRKPSRRLPSPSTLLGTLRSRDLALPLLYALVVAAAEVLAATVGELAGLALHAGAVVASFLQGTSRPPGPARAFFSTFWLVPLLRIYVLSQPYVGLSTIWWWALTAVPMLVAAGVAARLAGLDRRDVGLQLTAQAALAAALMLPIGIGIGLLGYLLLDPRPVVREASLGYPWLPLLVMAVNPALVRELVYRGVLLRSTTAAFGPTAAVGYTALLFGLAEASLPGMAPTPASFLFMLAVGLVFALITRPTGSIAPASAGHVGLTLSLFLIGPALIPSSFAGGAGVAPAPARPTPIEQASPARSPSPVVVLPPDGAPATSGSPAPGGAAAAKPGATVTVVVLVPPPALSPPPVAAPPPGAPPPASPAPGAAQPPGVEPGQVFVVRGTDNAGARLRSQPTSSSPTLAIVAEYTPLTSIGPDRVADGVTWRQVRTPGGQEGWIASQFLTAGAVAPPSTPRP